MFVGNIQLHGINTTDADGRFRFALPDYTGTANLFLKVKENTSKKIRLQKKPDFDQANDKSDFFVNYSGYEEEEEGGHWQKYFIHLDRVYSPYPKLYAFYEQHVLEYDMQELLRDAPELVRSPEATDYSLDLPEAMVSGRKVLREMDYNQPAIVLNPFEEYNLQTDIGMGWGNISKYSIGILASARLGLKGKYLQLIDRRRLLDIVEIETGENFKYKLTNGIDYYNSPDNKPYYDPSRSYFYFKPDTLLYPDEDTKNNAEEYFYPGYTLMEMPDVVASKIPDSIRYKKHINIEHVKQISIYTDKDGREPYGHDQIHKSYTSDFIINYESFLNNTYVPVYKGRRVNLLGYSPECEFYHPDYSKGVLPELRDYRRTLYWNPDVRTDNQGRAHIRFYNNANCRTIRISAESLSNDGQPLMYYPTD